MKRTGMILVVLVVVLLGSAVGASAFAAPRIHVNIGFSFYAGNQLLPAGEYWIEMLDLGCVTATGSTLAIRSTDNANFSWLSARAGSRGKLDAAAYVVFNRIGDAYFLSKVLQGSIESTLVKGRTERELKLADGHNVRGKSSQTVVIAAAR